jgi:hypothetical protein
MCNIHHNSYLNDLRKVLIARKGINVENFKVDRRVGVGHLGRKRKKRKKDI